MAILPAASSFHSGTTTTWRSPNGLHEHCIDHVAFPHMSLPNCTFSGVLEDFDLGNGLHDHFALLDADDLQDREQIIYNCVKGRVLTWEILQRTLNGLRAEATEHDVAVLLFDMAQFHELLQKFATHTSWPFLNEEIEAGQGHWNREVHTLVGFCIQEAHDPRRSELHSPVPRGFGKERFSLHLFSGRRRTETLSSSSTSWLLLMASSFKSYSWTWS